MYNRPHTVSELLAASGTRVPDGRVVHVAQELRAADSEGFARLWQRGQVMQHHSRPAPGYVLALEYVLVTLLTTLLAATTAAAFLYKVSCLSFAVSNLDYCLIRWITSSPPLPAVW